MSWNFSLPTKIYFGTDKINELPEIIKEFGFRRGVLVCSNTLKKNGVAEGIIKNSDGRLVAVFSDIRPNPTTDNVNDCVKVLRENVILKEKFSNFAVWMGKLAVTETYLPNKYDRKDVQKVTNALIQRGHSYSDVRSAMQQFTSMDETWEEE